MYVGASKHTHTYCNDVSERPTEVGVAFFCRIREPEFPNVNAGKRISGRGVAKEATK
jgi:hypothetical protein